MLNITNQAIQKEVDLMINGMVPDYAGYLTSKASYLPSEVINTEFATEFRTNTVRISAFERKGHVFLMLMENGKGDDTGITIRLK